MFLNIWPLVTFSDLLWPLMTKKYKNKYLELFLAVISVYMPKMAGTRLYSGIFEKILNQESQKNLSIWNAIFSLSLDISLTWPDLTKWDMFVWHTDLSWPNLGY